MDLKNFSEKEQKGLAAVVRITENAFAVSYKRFDAGTGTELAEEVVGGNLQELRERKTNLQTEIDEIDAFIKKVEALTPQNEEKE